MRPAASGDDHPEWRQSLQEQIGEDPMRFLDRPLSPANLLAEFFQLERVRNVVLRIAGSVAGRSPVDGKILLGGVPNGDNLPKIPPLAVSST